MLSLYEDFLCPHCGQFEKEFGPTVSTLVDSGVVAVDYSPTTPDALVAKIKELSG